MTVDDTAVSTAPRTTTEPRRGRLPRLSRSYVAPAVAVLVLLLTFVVWLTRPGGDIQGAQTQSITVTGTSGPIEAGTEIVQKVTATQDGLKGFMATFGTYGGVTDCALAVTVTDDAGSTVDDETVPCAGLTDTSNASQVADFPPVADSAGRTYTITYTAAPGTWSQAVVLWVGTPRGAAVPAEAHGSSKVEAAFGPHTATATVAEYTGPSTWDQVWRAFGLAALEGPWWAQPAAMAVWVLGALVAIVGALALSGHRRAATGLIIALAIFRGLIWGAVIPPLEGMDEGAHVGYAQFLAEAHQIPIRGTAYHGIAGTLSEQLGVLDQYQHRDALPPGDRAAHDPADVRSMEAALAAASPEANGSSSASGYPPLYYAPAAVFYDLTPGTLADKIYGMRLWSILLGGLAAWATIAVGRRLFPSRPLAATLLALAVTLQPMMAHQFAIVNNDALVIAAGIAAFAAALRMATGAVRWRDALLAGLAVGAALLAKPYGIGALPVVGIGLLVGAVRAAPRLRRFLVACFWLAVGLAVTYGPWVLAQKLLHIPSTDLPVYADGDQSRGMRHYIELQLQDGASAMRWRWAEQLFGMFSWLDIHLPKTAYDLAWKGVRIIVALAVLWFVWQVVELVVRLVRRPGPGRTRLSPVADLVALEDGGLTSVTRTSLAVIDVVGLMITLFAAGYLYFRSSGRDELLQGRYALMALPAFLALPALTLQAFARPLPERWRAIVPTAVLALVAGAMWTLQVISIATIADRFYL